MRLNRPLMVAVIGCFILLTDVSLRAGESAIDEVAITEKDREHWSFRPLRRTQVNNGESRFATTNPIDSFINSQFTQHQLEPLPRADRVTLIRRITLDLVGLPPEPNEVDAFLNDLRPGAYRRIVDRLLASPQYGERWGQHWLDLARFAETDGFEHDKVRPKAWQFRDWVIRALNEDMPYDQFVIQQIAGDRLSTSEEDTSIATAFCLSGPDMPDINSQEERRHSLLNEMTATIGSALLGLQFGCAQCHDHKYDPISQGDFYRMRAIFQPAVHVKRNQSISTLNVSTSTPEPSFLMLRGQWNLPGPQVAPAYPRIANWWGDSPGENGDSPDARMAFARWLMRSDHPLTARVIVNRIWQHHFGHGLSRTPSDFGVMSDSPSHPLLLDHLAADLIQHDWSLKWLHRQILTSEAYRRASSSTAIGWTTEEIRRAKRILRRARERDPDNRWLARFPRRRLDAEVIRDCMLAAAGLLDTKQGGPGVMPPLAQELAATLLKNQWKTTENLADHHRRSIYIFARRNLRYPILEAFDRPEANASCAVRGRSTTASQSLFMLNSQFSYDMCRELATRLVSPRVRADADWVDDAFRRILSRNPSKAERHDFEQILGSVPPVSVPSDAPELELVVDACLALFNCSEFAYVD